MKIFKKIIILTVLISLISVSAIGADQLKDDENYIKAQELFELAKQEFDRGDYDKGYEYSEEAKEYLKKANLYNLLRMLKINMKKQRKLADEAIQRAKKFGAEKNEIASDLLKQSLQSFEDGDSYALSGDEKEDDEVKAEEYQKAVDSYVKSKDLADQAFSNLPEARKYSWDKLQEANNKRIWLIDNGYIEKDDEDDSSIKKIIDEGKDAFDKKDYYQTFLKAEEALDLIDKIFNKKKAERLLEKAKYMLEQAKEEGAESDFPTELEEAESLLNEAVDFFNNEKYNNSIEKSEAVIEIIKSFGYTFGPSFPKYYVVRLLQPKRDCLWRIAQYDFVYGNGKKWKIIYEANKDKLEDPENPDLIEPGVIILIPSLKGEERDGTYDPGNEYEKFDPDKDYSK